MNNNNIAKKDRLLTLTLLEYRSIRANNNLIVKNKYEGYEYKLKNGQTIFIGFYPIFHNSDYTCVACNKITEKIIICGPIAPNNNVTRAKFVISENNGYLNFLTKDHIIPKSISNNNKRTNLQAMCYSCNTKKGCSVVDSWNTLSKKDKVLALKRIYDRINARLANQEYITFGSQEKIKSDICFIEQVKPYLDNSLDINVIPSKLTEYLTNR